DDLDDDLPALRVVPETDLTFGIRILDRVDQEVRNALPEALPIAGHVERLQWLREQQLLTPGTHKRLHHFDSRLDAASDRDLLRPQSDPSLGDARYIQQVIDQTSELAGLAPYHTYQQPFLGSLGWHDLQEGLRRIPNGRERVTQLVGEHREELIL